MKTGAFMLALLWFAASTYAGYRLTERSFAWIDQPNFGIEKQTSTGTAPALKLDALKGKIPAPYLEQASKLTWAQIDCIQSVLGPSGLQAVQSGKMTPEVQNAIQTCLK